MPSGSQAQAEVQRLRDQMVQMQEGLYKLNVTNMPKLATFVVKAPLKIMFFNGVCNKSAAKGHVLQRRLR
ncbi:Glycine dehydrogenase [decarboxylating] [Gossypium arboreum]|uniref:Glycine dehydrogenase [decarboxylating] n=1 Tax=Gossypium arboreum TaxID=29729 RepID=A0A0B0N3H4_GOSAR|nr:Glycine dehydrogenase [decarboxylating] [Gossypium arboreum]